MYSIVSPFQDCFHNIASEEYFLSSPLTEDIFYLYRNEPSIIVGCNQNTVSEINYNFIKKNHINVVRRRSGGGAVYHDLGNLNFGFIFENEQKEIEDVFREFTAPILSTLHDLGVPATFSGRNDLTIHGKKFSGNAQFRTTKKILIHGTLLFDSDLSVVSQALNASPLKFQDKGVKSIKSRVTNIRPYLKNDFTMIQFQEKILSKIQSLFPDCKNYVYTEQDQTAIETLVQNKYSTWNWTFGNSPQFTYHHLFKYEKGLVELFLTIERGIIQSAKIFGDFFGNRPDVDAFARELEGLAYEERSILDGISHLSVSEYISGLSNEDFCHKIFDLNV